jgi:hypothetical protein
VDLDGNPHTQNPPAPLIPDLDRHVSGIALQQAIPSNLCRALSSIQIVEFETVVITGEAVTSRTSK